MIIGITGTQAAGKGTVVELLEKKGFEHFGASEFLKQIILETTRVVNRDTYKKVADNLRKQHGGDYIIRRLYEFSQMRKNSIIESVRTVAEIEFLKSKGAVILAIDAPIQERYKRAVARGGSKDDIDFDKFKEQEEAEMHNTGEHEINLAKCMEMADFKIENTGSVEDLQKQVDEFLEKFSK